LAIIGNRFAQKDAVEDIMIAAKKCEAAARMPEPADRGGEDCGGIWCQWRSDPGQGVVSNGTVEIGALSGNSNAKRCASYSNLWLRSVRARRGKFESEGNFTDMVRMKKTVGGSFAETAVKG